MGEQQQTATAETILKNLDGMFVTKYLTTLESAKKTLAEYLVNIADLEKRMEKVESPTMRKVMGEDSLVSKKAAIQATLEKLEIHMRASFDRLKS